MLLVCIDGICVDGHHVIAAVRVDDAGDKHLLSLSLGATENAQVVKDLLRWLTERGLNADAPYLLVTDGSKALRSAINEMFCTRAKVQRCRTYKLRNVLEWLPKVEAAQTKAVMMAAYRLEAKGGMAKLRKQTQWLQRELSRCGRFTAGRFGRDVYRQRPGPLPPLLKRCLCTTNIIENPSGIVRRMSRRVTRYRDAGMALRWTAAGFLETQKSFRKIQGMKDLWILEAALGRGIEQVHVDEPLKAA